jgi:hypothetical protein
MNDTPGAPDDFEPAASPRRPDLPPPVEGDEAGLGWASLALASLGSTLLGAVLALGILAYVNDGELEFRAGAANGPADAVATTGDGAAPGDAGAEAAADEPVAALRTEIETLEREVTRLSDEVEALRGGMPDGDDGGATSTTADATAEHGTVTPPSAVDTDTPAATATERTTAEAPADDDAPTATLARSTATPHEALDTATPTAVATERAARTPRPTATLRIIR